MQGLLLLLLVSSTRKVILLFVATCGSAKLSLVGGAFANPLFGFQAKTAGDWNRSCMSTITRQSVFLDPVVCNMMGMGAMVEHQTVVVAVLCDARWTIIRLIEQLSTIANVIQEV